MGRGLWHEGPVTGQTEVRCLKVPLNWGLDGMHIWKQAVTLAAAALRRQRCTAMMKAGRSMGITTTQHIVYSSSAWLLGQHQGLLCDCGLSRNETKLIQHLAGCQ